MANVRYTQEKRIQVAEYVLDGRYSASVASKVFGIGVNTVCRWVNRLCEKRGLPCYRAERKGRRFSRPSRFIYIPRPGSSARPFMKNGTASLFQGCARRLVSGWPRITSGFVRRPVEPSAASAKGPLPMWLFVCSRKTAGHTVAAG